MKTMLLLCSLIVGSSAWAADATASFTVTGLSSVPASFTSSPALFTMSVAANGGTNPAQNGGSLRLYCKNQMTVVSAGATKIKKVSFGMKINASSGKYPLISAPSGSFSPAVTDNKATATTWTAATDEGVSTITFTFPANGASVGGNWTFSSVTVTYESSTPSSAASFDNEAPTLDLKDGSTYTQLVSTAAGYGGTVTYSIGATNTAGATINSSTGQVTVTKTGSVIVEASAAADGDDFTASTASYTLTVSDTRPAAGIYWDVKNTEIELNATSGYTVSSLVNPNSLTGITYEITGTAGLVSESAGVLSVDTSIKGEASVKAIYAGGTHKPSTVTCTIAVYDPTEKGTKYNPYSVADIIALNPTSSTVIKSSVYVTGYIIGATNSSTGALVNSNVGFDTNLALADTPNETEDFISAQLPSGDIRTALNVKSTGHPYYIGCGKVLMKGDVAQYCKRPGVKNVSSGELIGQSIKVTSAGLSTYCTDVNLAFDGTLEAYIAKEEGGAIKLHQVTNVPANTGVLLRAPGIVADTYFDVATTESADVVTGNLFQKGTDAAVATGTGPYNWILSKKSGVVGFYHANGNTVAKNRAYLQTSTASARINLNFDDEDATAIEAVKAQNVENGQYFNLAGQRVAQPTKGLYIVNGKKVIIK